MFLVGYKGTVYPPSDDKGTERTWFEPEERPRTVFLNIARQAFSKRTPTLHQSSAGLPQQIALAQAATATTVINHLQQQQGSPVTDSAPCMAGSKLTA